MAKLVQRWIKYFLLHCGAFLPARAVLGLDQAMNYLRVGR
jgi:hypothetical protein